MGYAGVYAVESGFVERLTSLLHGTGLTPVYAPRTGGGFSFFSEHFIKQNSFLVLTATTWNDFRQLYSISWKHVALGGGFYSDYALRYRSLTNEHFYGIGPYTQDDDNLEYAEEDALFEISLGRQLSKALITKIDIGVSNTSVFRSRRKDNPALAEVYADSTLPGVRENVRLQGIEYSLRYTNTNHPAHPTAGQIGKIGATLFTDIKDDRFSFWKFHLDLTQHIQLFRDRIIVLRGASEITQGFDDPDIPFYHLAELGSHETIRGFSRGRFRDKDYVLGTAEYRYPIWIPWAKVVDAVAFVDAGQVANSIYEDARITDLQVGYGGGFRFYSAKALIARTELAFSKEGVRFYLTLNS